jgi:hypothetical protein
MNKIKDAIGKLFEDKVDEGGLDNIVELIEVKIAAKAQENLDEAVVAKTEEITQNLNEKNTIDLGEYKTQLANTISKYLDIALVEFVEENSPKIESEIVVEMSKNLVIGISSLLKENNVNIPEKDIDIVTDLEEKITDLNTRLSTQINENIESSQQDFEYEKAITFMSMTKKLALSQREKAQKLIESIVCNDIDSFKTKLDLIINEFDTSIAVDLDNFTPKEIKNRNKNQVEPGKTKADLLLK